MKKTLLAITVIVLFAAVFLAGAGTGIGKMATCGGAPTLGLETGGGGSPVMGASTSSQMGTSTSGKPILLASSMG